MLLLGIDLGTSSIKVSVVNAETQKRIASAQYPEHEVSVLSVQTGWAEQSPEMWWHNIQQAIRKINSTGTFDPHDIAAIGVAYQMHGLVVIDEEKSFTRQYYLVR